MELLLTIFRNEWRQLLRQKFLLITLGAFMVVCLLAIRSGNAAVTQQRIQIDSLQQAYAADFVKSLKRFTDTSTAQAKAQSKYAGSPSMVNFRLPQNVIKTPAPLAGLSLGLYDIQPWYQQVKWTVDYLTPPNVPVSNPMVLLAGNFDLSFVVIYLLPLLVIGSSYAVYAQEKETGTLTLLSVQGSNLHRIVVYKLLFRFIVLLSLILLVNGVGFIWVSGKIAMPLPDLLYWSGLSITYLLFWFALSYLVVAYKLTAPLTGLWLVSAWLLLLIILPALANMYINLNYPTPLRDDISSARRQQGEEIWGTKPAILVDSFNRSNPQYAAGINIKKDTVHLSNRFVAGYYDLLQRRMQRVIAPMEEQLRKRKESLEALSRWNPAINTGQLFNGLAGTRLGSYENFKRQASAYQQRWKAFLYEFEMKDEDLLQKDFYRLPQFNYQPDRQTAKPFFQHFVLMLFLLLLFMTAGSYRFKKLNTLL